MPYQEYWSDNISTCITDAVKREWKRQEKTLRAPTGAGKTEILISVIKKVSEECANVCFVWISIGKGNLDRQSYSKLKMRGIDADLYNQKEKVEKGEVLVLNWEKLTKKNNISMRDGEFVNFPKMIDNTIAEDRKIILIIDESHHSAGTNKSKEIIDVISPSFVLKASATPTISNPHFDVPIEEVIRAGMVKKGFIVNKGVTFNGDSPIKIVFCAMLRQFLIIEQKYVEHQIQPLFGINVENAKGGEDGEETKIVLEYLKQNGYTTENGSVAIWTTNQKVNLKNIVSFDSPVKFIIFKHAIASGWDCPRMCGMLELRKNMGEAFEIQVLGRTFRMPERRHYGDDDLDCSFIFTNDANFKIGEDVDDCVYLKTTSLKEDITNLQLPSVYQQKDWEDIQKNDMILDQTVIKKISELKEEGKFQKNFERGGTILVETPIIDMGDDCTRRKFNVGESERDDLCRLEDKVNNLISDNLPVGTKPKRTIDRRTFNGPLQRAIEKHFELEEGREWEQICCFIINNGDIFAELIRSSVEEYWRKKNTINSQKTRKDNYSWQLPKELSYKDGLSNFNKWPYKECCPKFDSHLERGFADYLDSSSVDWWYKNGQHGRENLGLLGCESVIYPDFIAKKGPNTYIFETRDISRDLETTSKKHSAITQYINKNKNKNISGGIVVKRGSSFYVFVGTSYNKNLLETEGCWQLVSEFIDYY